MAEEKNPFPEKLKACWHPVAYSNELADKPYGTFLLDQAIVVWRDSTGQVHAMKDLCVHRGTALLRVGKKRLSGLPLSRLGIQQERRLCLNPASTQYP